MAEREEKKDCRVKIKGNKSAMRTKRIKDSMYSFAISSYSTALMKNNVLID